MQIFQFLIIPQYVLCGVLVPLHGVPSYLDAAAHAMPMRYVVELTRAAFYAGTPGYRQVVSGGPWLDAAVTAALFAVFMIAGESVLSYRETSPLISYSPGRARTRADTGVALPLSQQPVFGSPEQIPVYHGLPVASPPHALAVVPDQILRTAAVHRPPGRAWRHRDSLPRLPPRSCEPASSQRSRTLAHRAIARQPLAQR
jgi:ABC-2 type transporter